MFMPEMVLENFLENIDSIKLCNSGDGLENYESGLVNSIFPNYEAFWKWFVVPTTFRIYQFSEHLTNPCTKRDRFQIANSVCNKYSSAELDLLVELEDNKPLYLETRPEVSDQVKEIGLAHYSILLHLTKANNLLKDNLEDGFEYAIVHLASICDLVEDFLEKLLLFLAACKKEPVALFAEMPLASYLELAKSWYQDNYSNIYEHYLSKGKNFKFVLPSRVNLLDSFLKKDPKWRKTKNAFRDIRTYRNKVVHSPFLLNIKRSGKLYLPTPKVISKLYTYDQIREAWADPNRRKNEFDEKQKIGLDIQRSLFSAINDLWGSLVEEVKMISSQKNCIYLSGIGMI